MGDEYETDQHPSISVKVAGTHPLYDVEVRRGLETLYRHPFAQPKDDEDQLIRIEWSGVRVKSRPKRVDWTGGLSLGQGRIRSYREYAFDDPQQGVKRLSNQRLTWTSTTSGDIDGVILDLDASREAEVTFYSNPITFSFKLNEITDHPLVVEAGGVDQRVKVSAISRSRLPRCLEFSYVDEKPQEGMNPYWVKVVQSNGGIAWSSPVYVKKPKYKA